MAGRHVVGVDDVLHTHGDAAQDAAFRRVGRLGLRQREVGIEIGPGFDHGLALGDALEAGPHQRLRRERAGLYLCDSLAGGKRLHVSALRAQAAMSSRAASSCWRPTSWMPTGRPVGPLVKGKVTHGIQR
jgi:hypothetical protein